MPKVVTFGEIMMRLSPPGYERVLQCTQWERTFGGAEANVAVSLAQFGVHAAFVTKLPQNPVAQACVNELRGLGVDTSGIVRGGNRIGVYYVEKGAAQRASTVVYDRAHSAIAE
ncbi:MAG: sugar kinase, partial [Armatimonadetes bacterium]|nr:sugar kinase [Armatimonadota bacterium]